MIAPLLISITDFPDYVPFSVNIGAQLVEPHIRDAQLNDVHPLVPADVWSALETAIAAASAEFFPAEYYAPEYYAIPASADFSDAGLSKLWFGFVRPLLVCESARRMLLWHGAHVTPNGLETISDVGHMPVSGAVRTELRADLQAKCVRYRARLLSGLRAYLPTTPSSCHSTRRRPSSGGLTTSVV